jgi:hypothetical protein
MFVRKAGLRPFNVCSGGTQSHPVSTFTENVPRFNFVLTMFLFGPGLPSMDYFISGEFMEQHDEHESHYSEQDMLIVGQGIWYDRLQVSKVASCK